MMHDDKPKFLEIMKRSHELFKEAGMPEDRIDYILQKWAKFVSKKSEDKKPSNDDWRACTAAKARCMKDGAKVETGRCGFVWGKCAEEVTRHEKPSNEDWRACTAAKSWCMKDGVKFTDGRCGAVWEKCAEEVEEHSAEKKKEGDKKDCYFDEACHKLVDWSKIAKVKDGVLARMKATQGDEESMNKLMKVVHEMFKEAGMPDDRIDYILEKWAKYVADREEIIERSLTVGEE